MCNKLKKLISDMNYIRNGIISITTSYQHEITFYLNKEFEEKIVSAILQVYENEIDKTEKAMKSI